MAAISSLSIADALSSAGSAPTGLTAQDAERRIRDYGPNQVERIKRQPWPLRLLQEFTQFLSIIVLLGGGWQFGQNLAATDMLYLQATTACFSTIIVMQIVNVFLCRSSVRSIFSVGFADNPLILWGVALELAFLLLINYSPWVNTLLGTAPVPPALWLFILPLALAMLALEETRKWLVRRTLPTSQPPE